MEIGRPIQIVRLEGESRISLDIEALRTILLAAKVKNLPVMVVSVAGRARKGKSFLLNFFLQYMRNRTKKDWMADTDARLRGFSWCCGSEPETTGIWMWNEVFVVTTTGGKQVAVLFLDTQGTFDGRSTVKDCVRIFALSMMASSVQIYNLSQNIDEDDLQYLQLFTAYGRLVLEAIGKKPFQKLLFLVRDWQYKFQKPYGFEGGNSLLEQRLLVSKNQKPELRRLREDIKPCFMEMCCFLMPNPGEKVTSTDTFDGSLCDISNDFKEHVRVLVTSVLEPNKTVVKQIAGLDITCQELLVHLERQVEMFNRDELPEPKSMIEATAETNNMTAANRAIDFYKNGMEKVFRGGNKYLETDFLQKQHLLMRQSALEQFVRAPKIGGVALSNPHKTRLLTDIDGLFECFSKRNEGARIMAQSKRIMEETRTNAQRMLDEARCRSDNILEEARAQSKNIQMLSVGMGLAMMGASGLARFLPPAAGAAAAVARTAPMAMASVAQLIHTLQDDNQAPALRRANPVRVWRLSDLVPDLDEEEKDDHSDKDECKAHGNPRHQ